MTYGCATVNSSATLDDYYIGDDDYIDMLEDYDYVGDRNKTVIAERVRLGINAKCTGNTFCFCALDFCERQSTVDGADRGGVGAAVVVAMVALHFMMI